MKLDLIAASAEPPARAAEPLGLVLGIDARGIERVLAAQREQGVRFGEAARALGLATQAEIERALARQFGLACIAPGAAALGEELVAAYEPAGPQAEALRAVRDQLLLRWLERKPESRALAILSAARGEGRSFIAANLAVVFSQLGSRTLLVDADLRNARQHRCADHRGARGRRPHRRTPARLAPVARAGHLGERRRGAGTYRRRGAERAMK